MSVKGEILIDGVFSLRLTEFLDNLMSFKFTAYKNRDKDGNAEFYDVAICNCRDHVVYVMRRMYRKYRDERILSSINDVESVRRRWSEALMYNFTRIKATLVTTSLLPANALKVCARLLKKMSAVDAQLPQVVDEIEELDQEERIVEKEEEREPVMEPIIEDRPEKATYHITIKTNGQYEISGTKANISIQLVSVTGDHTEWKVLNCFWRRYFRCGSTDTFTIEDKNIGRPVLIRIKLDKKAVTDSWACDYIIVKYGDMIDEFPVYDWITESIDVVEGTATLPQNVENPYLVNARDDEKAENLLMYVWEKKSDSSEENWKLPRYQACTSSEDLPQIFKIQDQRIKRCNDLESVAKWNGFLVDLKNRIFSIKTLEDYKTMFIHHNLPTQMLPFLNAWNDDNEFGRQMLNGVSPTTLVRCLKIPSTCNINHERVKLSLTGAHKLEKEMLNGRVYMKDFTQRTAGVKRNMQDDENARVCPDAIAIFYVTDEKEIRPIAIQLEPNNPESIFTPHDDKFDWMLAKMYFRCAEHNAAVWGDHFMLHSAMEPVAVSLFRYLPRSHPIYKLLRPHLQSLPGINQRARDRSNGEEMDPDLFRALNGQDQTNRSYEYFDYSDLHMPERFKRQGVHDRDLLPNYYFRDDALMMWHKVEEFVSKIISYYYEDNQAVADDNEIQTWIAGVAMDGYAWFDGYARGCPGNFKTKGDLITYVTTIIYTCSFHHAALNYCQFDYFKFIPNSPAAMRLPIHKRGEGSLQRVLNSLPTAEMACLQIGNAYVDSRYMLNEVFIGKLSMKLFTEPEVIEILRDFEMELRDAQEQIKERNQSQKKPYDYLSPDKVPASITA